MVGPSQGEAYIKMKLRDQEASLAMVESDAGLKALTKVGRGALEGHSRGTRGALEGPTLRNECQLMFNDAH